MLFSVILSKQMKGVDLIKKLGAVLLGALDKRGAFWK